MSSIHHSNFGSLGAGLPVDLDGYTHTTIQGWLSAPYDHGTGRMPDIRAIRNCLGISQAELARIAGVSQPTVAGWEAGYRRPSKSAMIAIETHRAWTTRIDCRCTHSYGFWGSAYYRVGGGEWHPLPGFSRPISMDYDEVCEAIRAEVMATASPD